jgi:hypothetical protein
LAKSILFDISPRNTQPSARANYSAQNSYTTQKAGGGDFMLLLSVVSVVIAGVALAIQLYDRRRK